MVLIGRLWLLGLFDCGFSVVLVIVALERVNSVVVYRLLSPLL